MMEVRPVLDTMQRKVLIKTIETRDGEVSIYSISSIEIHYNSIDSVECMVYPVECQAAVSLFLFLLWHCLVPTNHQVSLSESLNPHRWSVSQARTTMTWNELHVSPVMQDRKGENRESEQGFVERGRERAAWGHKNWGEIEGSKNVYTSVVYVEVSLISQQKRKKNWKKQL